MCFFVRIILFPVSHLSYRVSIVIARLHAQSTEPFFKSCELNVAPVIVLNRVPNSTRFFLVLGDDALALSSVFLP